jgi:3-deoxy-D-manno-octulosonic-acid transferase
MNALPAAARRSLFAYNLFFPVVLLALIPGIAARMFRRGGFRENFGQRFGRYRPEVRAQFRQGRWCWIHSISVGETLVALKLAHELHRCEPELQVVITVTTSTGFAVARDARLAWLAALYNPLDTRAIVRAALDLIRPERLILIEGETWPNLLAECHARRIPISLANARLSPRSEQRYLRARYWVGPIFSLCDQVCVPEPRDAARWQRLGVPAERVHVTGSIKFDSADGICPQRTEEFRQLLETIGVSREAPILLAGSTWAPEEKCIAEAFLELRGSFPDLFLILVPRHIERTAEILRDLAPLQLRLGQRSRLPLATPSRCDALLVDTTGELREWYSLATVVFIGKSLRHAVAGGGQNPAEPAELGKPVLFGPRMENFASLVSLLCSRYAAVCVPDAPALTSAVHLLLSNASARAAMGDRARGVLAAHRGATARTAEIISSAW